LKSNIFSTESESALVYFVISFVPDVFELGICYFPHHFAFKTVHYNIIIDIFHLCGRVEHYRFDHLNKYRVVTISKCLHNIKLRISFIFYQSSFYQSSRRRDTDSFYGVLCWQVFQNVKHFGHLTFLTYLNTHFMRFKISPILIIQFFRVKYIISKK